MSHATPLTTHRLGFLPGTGNMGLGLAKLYAEKGFTVGVGSRSVEKAQKAAAIVVAHAPSAHVFHGSLADVASKSDIIFWAPSGSLEERKQALLSIKDHVKGKVVVNLNNVHYLHPESQWGQISAIDVDSAALGGDPAIKWVWAFKTTGHHTLGSPLNKAGQKRQVAFGGDDTQAVEVVRQLIETLGYDPLFAGGSKIARLEEAVAVYLLSIVTGGEGLPAFFAGKILPRFNIRDWDIHLT